MEIMNERDRKKMILESRKFGGISLRRQILRVHKNGAKFPISKAYIDDELLDLNVSYTLILIPETKIATKNIVSLTIFKRRRGPLMLYSFPENSLNNLEQESISEMMTQSFKERFFVNQSTIVSSLNYYFEIHSDWARGNKEMLMISIILDRKINNVIEEIIQSLCLEFESDLNSNKEMFKALYITEMDSLKDEEQDDVRRINEDLKVNIKKFYNKINLLLKQKKMKNLITVSLEIEKKLDLNQIAQEIDDVDFNPERFPGLVMKIENPNATIIIFSNGKMVITEIKDNSEAKQVVEKVIEKIRKIGINISSPKNVIEIIK